VDVIDGPELIRKNECSCGAQDATQSGCATGVAYAPLADGSQRERTPPPHFATPLLLVNSLLFLFFRLPVAASLFIFLNVELRGAAF
jgi:hypothetical protein